MSSLSTYEPERASVSIKGGSFTVRGLSLADLEALVRHHAAEMNSLASAISDQVGAVAEAGGYARLCLNLIQDAPYIVADIISRAADEPDAVTNALKLPLAVSLDALQKIGDLTFQEIGGPKKFFEALASLFGKVAIGQTAAGSLGDV
jgi:hypothetical protein